MNILFVSSELAPYAKTGGLGDVTGSLPQALQKRGHRVACLLPFYRCVREALGEAVSPQGASITVPLGNHLAGAAIREAVTPEGIQLYLVEHHGFFDRAGLYGENGQTYGDNAARFIFLSKIAVEVARHLKPALDIVHLHDWHTALVPALIQNAGLDLPTVLTIHNQAYQGSFPSWDFHLSNLPPHYFGPQAFEYYGQFNLLKGGIGLCNQVTTVSPSYAEEIQEFPLGYGLDGWMRDHRRKLTGILNSVDTQAWNPAKDSFLAAPYNSRSLRGKATCKKNLLESFGLPWSEAPVFGMASRLVDQKGIDLLGSYADELLKQDCKLVMVGTGDAHYESLLRDLAKRHPKKMGVKIGFDEKLAHQIEAGSDFFLMPSHFEPCGLNQMYSQLYGTPPIVHGTGGLRDSVQDYNSKTGKGTGFVFTPYTREALDGAVRRALDVYLNKRAYRSLQLAGMKQDFSWDTSAARYEAVYKKALKS